MLSIIFYCIYTWSEIKAKGNIKLATRLDDTYQVSDSAILSTLL